MKRIIYALLAFFLVSSCKKDNTLSDGGYSDVPAVPSSFGQNVLIEQFTGTFNGQCPAADLLLDSALRLYPGRVIGVNIHVADSLSVKEITDNVNGDNALNDLFNPVGQIPAGMVNRNITDPSADLDVTDYFTKVSETAGLSPRCGIAIDANDIVNGWLDLFVHIGLSADLPGEYRLHVYLVEDVFTSTDSIYDQFNDFSQNGPTPVPNSVLFSLPYEINGYSHVQVLRKIVNTGGYPGESLSGFSMVAGNEIVSNYRLDVSDIDAGAYSIVAFVDKYGPDGTTHRVENARSVRIGQVASWN
ncbi:MAG: hypothetical protein RL213_904 [Bacteroidota bacterium]|jgi:hypothetical protein